MKIKYLGTAACEGIPAMFCDCDVCNLARARGGKEIRTRSQAIIDNKIIIDFPADTYLHVLRDNLLLQNYEYLLITHSHSDHLYVDDFENRKRGYAHFKNQPALKVFAATLGYEKIKNFIDIIDIGDRVEAIKIEKDFYIEDYLITPIKANHDESSSPVVFAITHKDKSLLYANDTGYFCEESWEKLRNLKKPFDFISLDCTSGMQKNIINGHMSFDTVLNVVKKMKLENIINNKTKIAINHFSHNGLINHAELVTEAGKNNIIVSYDGLELEF